MIDFLKKEKNIDKGKFVLYKLPMPEWLEKDDE